ncbi:MAG: hypothetical protein QNJ77_11495 [Acidimicrobiia bacterium]|nr:hypothetical protein [Acidimicrobiia bacterium]
MVRLKLLLSVLTLLAACGGDTASTTTAVPQETTMAPTSTVTSTAAPTTTSTVAPTTQAPTTSTTATTTLTKTAPVLEDGRPATFLAVTEEYVAVEVDTVTGEIIHSFGQTGTAEQMAAAEEMPPNVLVGAWRNREGSIVGLSDCCEPAAGRIFYVDASGELVDPYGTPGPAGWTLTPSPVDNRFANLGYSMVVVDPLEPVPPGEYGVWIDEPGLGFPGGAAAWARDGSRLFWIGQIEKVTALATLELADGEPKHVTVLPWVGVHQYLDGIGSQESGNLVGFLHTRNDDFEIVASEGVVFSATGEVLANFPVETGSWWGGYDQSGRFLIYVDGDNAVRWQGLGQAGALADGFIFASW